MSPISSQKKFAKSYWKIGSKYNWFIVIYKRWGSSSTSDSSKNKISKDYEAIIEGKLSSTQKEKSKEVSYIGQKEFGKAEILNQITEKTRSKVLLRLRQGKKREIRRIFFKIKFKLHGLKRIAFSEIKLGDLKEGHCRQLTKSEIYCLKIQCINIIIFSLL